MSSATADNASTIANEIHTSGGDGTPVTLVGILSSRWFLYCLSSMLFLAVWYWVVYLNILGRGLCYPHEVLSAIGDLATRKLAGASLWEHIWASARRVLLGFSLAVIVGIPLGFFMGINRYVNAIVNPVFSLIKPMPPIAWISLSILWLGIGEEPKIFIIFLGAFVPVVLNSYNGIRLIEEELYDVVRMSGGTGWKETMEVSFPASLPAVFAGLQISLSGAWTCVLAAELVSSRSGLGFVIVQGMNQGKADMVIAGMMMIACIAAVSSWLISVLERSLCPWRRDLG